MGVLLILFLLWECFFMGIFLMGKFCADMYYISRVSVVMCSKSGIGMATDHPRVHHQVRSVCGKIPHHLLQFHLQSCLFNPLFNSILQSASYMTMMPHVEMSNQKIPWPWSKRKYSTRRCKNHTLCNHHAKTKFQHHFSSSSSSSHYWMRISNSNTHIHFFGMQMCHHRHHSPPKD